MVGEEVWGRFSLGLLQRGVEAGKHGFYRSWVQGFLTFLRPRKWDQVVREDVESYLEKLAAEGKAGWQVEQANRALALFYREVCPLEWAAKNWPKTPEAAELGLSLRPAKIPGGEIDGPKMEALAGRSDAGQLPGRFASFLEEVRECLRAERYAYRTEETYVEWVRRFLIFAQPTSREELEAGELETYLNYLALVRRVSASTQNQALNALQFLFRKVLRRGVRELEEVTRAEVSRRLPVVLSREEVARLMGELRGRGLLMAQLMYGAGLRVNECVRLRVKDVDFDQGLIVVQEGKGNKTGWLRYRRGCGGVWRRIWVR